MERVRLVSRLMASSSVPEARQWASYVQLRGLQRLAGDSLEKKYINLLGGPMDCPKVARLMSELHLAGFGPCPWLDHVPGPLLRATHHGESLPYTHMPIVPGSTYEILHDIFDEAYSLTQESGPDPELDLQGWDEPVWGHHSLRRFADTVARETMSQTGASEQDIDLVFGWMENMYSAKMQLHYQSRFTRTKRAAVTSLA